MHQSEAKTCTGEGMKAKTHTMKNTVRLLVSLALSGFFLWLAFRRVDMHAVMASLRRVHVGYVALYVLSLMTVQVFRAFRWDVLVRPFARLSPRAVWRISNVGNMLIMLLPLRLGELARPYLMKKQAGASFTSTMGAVTVERVIDGLLVTLLFFATTSVLPAQYKISGPLRYGAFAALALFAGATLVVAAALLTHGLVHKLFRKLAGGLAPHLVDKMLGILDAFINGLRSLPSAQAIVLVVAWTLAYWAANALGLYWLMCAFDWSLPVVAAFVLVCVLVIGIMVPAGPGFLGTYQTAIVAGLAVFGVGNNDALAYSMVAYPLNLLVVVAFGLPYLFGQGGLHVGEMVESKADPTTKPTGAQRSAAY